jgi:hypothetical protein
MHMTRDEAKASFVIATVITNLVVHLTLALNPALSDASLLSQGIEPPK